jgi:hypothetical protein
MYKLKKGYLLGNAFQEIVDSLGNEVDISWYTPLTITSKNKLDVVFWKDIDYLLKSDYLLVTSSNTNTFQLGVAWTINYIRKILIRSGHKEAVKQLDKFGIADKNIIGLINDETKDATVVAIQDQGKEFKNSKAIVTYIKDKEK